MNKYEKQPLPYFSALMGYMLGDDDADEYLKSIGHDLSGENDEV